MTAKCVCPEKCPSEKDPVCGDNGETYDNECQLKLESCKTKQPIIVSSKGECGKFSTVNSILCKLLVKCH